MEFARVQGTGLAVLGLLLLLLQGYFLFHTAGTAGSPTQAAPEVLPAEHTVSHLPGIIGAIALGIGAFLVFVQAKRRGNDEVQPKKTPSGLPL